MRNPIPSSVLMLSLLLASVAYGQDRIDHACAAIGWDYPTEIEIAGFALYASQTSGAYQQDSRLAFIPAMPTRTLQIPCSTVTALLPSYGVWYVVVQAWGIHGERSGYSDELTVRYGEEIPPFTPYTPPPVPPFIPPPPGPRVHVPPTRPLPPMPGQGEWLTDTDAWKGKGASPPRLGPPIVLPPVPSQGSGWLTESCQWKGNCPR